MTNFSTMPRGGRDGPFVPFYRQLASLGRALNCLTEVAMVGKMLHTVAVVSGVPNSTVFM
jgi:hypothetical protein